MEDSSTPWDNEGIHFTWMGYYHHKLKTKYYDKIKKL
jgi:hypothetical protein